MTSTELAVVGAGPAGLAAAVTAARLGLHVTLIDEAARLGGQYLKGKSSATAPPFSRTEQQGRTMLAEIASLDVTLRLQTLVWGIEGRRLALAGPDGVDWLDTASVVIATGGRELVPPFPGWTLPGVITLGGAQLLAKSHSLIPGQRVLLAGSGPLLLPVAGQLSRLGAQVIAILEATQPGQWFGHAPAVWGNWDRLAEGWHYWQILRRAKIPWIFGQTVTKVLGESKVEAVVTTRLNRQGQFIAGSEKTIPVDAVCVGFGFTPNIELTQLAGCDHRFDPRRGGWVPVVDGRQETSISNVFATGETCGIAGAAAAMVEGEIAALSAAQRLGRITSTQRESRIANLIRHRRRLQRFGTMLNTLFGVPSGFAANLPDKTVVCRCEEITAGQVRAAIGQGAMGLDSLKNHVRMGQGMCQGRTCGPIVADMLAHQTGQPIAEFAPFRARPPVKPLPLGILAGEESP